jgi:Domain of unknown function DUF29
MNVLQITAIPVEPRSLYDRDFLAWLKEQQQHLRSENWTHIDRENLLEELEALGRSEQRELGSYVQVLLMHLLKWEYQPENRSRSWETTIVNCRDQIQDCLEDMPSLNRNFQDPVWMEKYYRRARREAVKETGLPIDRFPQTCPFDLSQILQG